MVPEEGSYSVWLANCCFASVGQSDIALNLDTVPIRQGHSSATHQRRGIVQILISLTGRPSRTRVPRYRAAFAGGIIA